MKKIFKNKKGSSLSFITAAFILAILYFLFFSSFGLGGGFEAAWKAGSFAKQIPGWFWIGLGVVVLIKSIGK